MNNRIGRWTALSSQKILTRIQGYALAMQVFVTQSSLCPFFCSRQDGSWGLSLQSSIEVNETAKVEAK
jgi:hypothetical protein